MICSGFLLRVGELLIKIRLLRTMSRQVLKISKDGQCHPWVTALIVKGVSLYFTLEYSLCHLCPWPLCPSICRKRGLEACGLHRRCSRKDFGRFCPWGWPGRLLLPPARGLLRPLAVGAALCRTCCPSSFLCWEPASGDSTSASGSGDAGNKAVVTSFGLLAVLLFLSPARPCPS